MLYDVTTLYFEAEKEDRLRKVGYSKERRVDPQIVVGLLVDRAGFPLEIGCFEGNKAETTTILPIIQAFQQRHDLADMVVVADAGMLSATNLAELDAAHLRFIVGSRMTKAPIDLASHFRWHGQAFSDGQIIDTLTPRVGRRSENNELLRAEPVWDLAAHPGSWRAVWAYSRKRAVRDNTTLTLQENKARPSSPARRPPARPGLSPPAKAPHLRRSLLARARMLVGLKGYVTNIPAAIMDPGKSSPPTTTCGVEASFRMSKTDLRPAHVRPHRRRHRSPPDHRVRRPWPFPGKFKHAPAWHCATCCASTTLRSATIAINSAVQTIPPAISDEQQTILDALTRAGVTH